MTRAASSSAGRITGGCARCRQATLTSLSTSSFERSSVPGEAMSPVMFICQDCYAVVDRKKQGRCLDCYRKYERDRSRARRARVGTTSQRGYGSDYQRRRAGAIQAQPWCSDCGHRGSADNPLTAEHINPVSQGGKDGPLAVLCPSCNSARGRAMNRGRGRAAKPVFLVLGGDSSAVFISLPEIGGQF